MIGGEVIDTMVDGDRVWVNARDVNHPATTCAIYVVRSRDAEDIRVGDTIWWQHDTAYWTPQSGLVHDCALRRIGYSGAPRPDGYQGNARRR